jgi:hypothetical protein
MLKKCFGFLNAPLFELSEAFPKVHSANLLLNFSGFPLRDHFRISVIRLNEL